MPQLSPQPSPMVSDIHHASLIVADTARSLAFYRDILGLLPLAERPDLGFPGAWLGVGERQIHLLELPNPDSVAGRPAHGGRDRHLALTAPDLEPLRARLDAAGIPYTQSRSGRRAIFCRDPDGNALELIEMQDRDLPHFDTQAPSEAPASPRPQGLLASLRLATAAAHASVEEIPAMTRLTSSEVTLADYRAYLCAIADVYGTLEPALFGALRIGLPPALQSGPPPDLGLRPKYPVLLRELHAHGLPIPPASEGLPVADLSAALGGLYVLEGATLGGRVIARHLRRYLGDVIPEGGLLDFHGEATSAVWKAFGAALDALAANGLIDPDRTLAGALRAFERVYASLAGSRRPVLLSRPKADSLSPVSSDR